MRSLLALCDARSPNNAIHLSRRLRDACIAQIASGQVMASVGRLVSVSVLFDSR